MAYFTIINEQFLYLKTNKIYGSHFGEPEKFSGIELFSPAKNFSFCWNFALEVARTF